MKAFTIDRYGSNDNVHAVQVPDPQLRDDDVLVEIHAASINPLDAKIRDGKVKTILPYRLPVILGNDLAGLVVRVGAAVRRFQPGDQVYARPDQHRIGTFAELISIKQDDVALKPTGLTMERGGLPPPRRSDRVASPCRTGRSEAGSKGSHPCRLRRPGIHRDSAGQASRCQRSHDNEHRERRMGQAPRCRSRHRLPHQRFRRPSCVTTTSCSTPWAETP